MSLNLKYGINKDTTSKKFGENFSTIDFELVDNISSVFSSRTGKKTTIGKLFIGDSSINLNMHDVERLIETLEAAYSTAFKKYKLGL